VPGRAGASPRVSRHTEQESRSRRRGGPRARPGRTVRRRFPVTPNRDRAIRAAGGRNDLRDACAAPVRPIRRQEPGDSGVIPRRVRRRPGCRSWPSGVQAQPLFGLAGISSPSTTAGAARRSAARDDPELARRRGPHLTPNLLALGECRRGRRPTAAARPRGPSAARRRARPRPTAACRSAARDEPVPPTAACRSAARDQPDLAARRPAAQRLATSPTSLSASSTTRATRLMSPAAIPRFVAARTWPCG
jgi:hypothetical protein